MKKNILLTFGTRAFAQRIAKMLTAEFNVFFASAEEIPTVLLAAGNYLKIPAGLLPTYAHELLKIALDKKIDYILPLGMHEIRTLADASILFEEYGIQVLSPHRDTLEDQVFLEEPMREIPTSLVSQGRDLLTGQQLTDATISGLVIASDEGAAYAVAVVATTK
ncbi:hypothetical protein J5U18_05835 [Sphingobacteriaceae bacterium WQ 2009]|uniref:PylC N-terminal domain-containing protein n=1 Tax=Rhinopithecimicrobium faecis TaxID=2820698 RepID=A0A8T4H8H9_9SPHI|nr:hypothetical protein [Sphingobacteriaceae bacterium WQ 2009]